MKNQKHHNDAAENSPSAAEDTAIPIRFAYLL